MRQYYFKNDRCRVKEASDPKCICWHDEGLGPLAGMEDYIREWRDKPAKSAISVEEQRRVLRSMTRHG